MGSNGYIKFLELLKIKYIPDEMAIEFERAKRDGYSVKEIKNLLEYYKDWYDAPSYSEIDDNCDYLIHAYESEELTLDEMEELWQTFRGSTWTEEVEEEQGSTCRIGEINE